MEMIKSVIVAGTSSCFCLLALILFFDVLSTFDPLVFFVSFVVPAFFTLFPSFLLKRKTSFTNCHIASDRCFCVSKKNCHFPFVGFGFVLDAEHK